MESLLLPYVAFKYQMSFSNWFQHLMLWPADVNWHRSIVPLEMCQSIPAEITAQF